MNEEEIISTLILRVNPNLLNRNSQSQAGAFPPVARSVVESAEKKLGFAFPSLLSRIWSEVANGGIGPGYGLYGLEGGLADEGMNLTLPDLCLEYRDMSYWCDLVGESASQTAFPICDWGCCTNSILDCSTVEGNILLLSEGTILVNQNVSFAKWFYDWLVGIDVSSDSYHISKHG